MATPQAPAVVFRQIRNPETSSFTYLVGDASRKRAVLVDPTPANTERDLAFLAESGLDLDYALMTHREAGPAEALRVIREKTGARIVYRRAALAGADMSVKGGDALPFGTQVVRVLDTPGFTADGLSYLIGKRVFTGNTLSVRGCGWNERVSDPGALYDSIVGVLFALPEDTIVYPAYDSGGVTATTIGAEQRFNPLLAARDRSSFVASCRAAQAKQSTRQAAPGVLSSPT